MNEEYIKGLEDRIIELEISVRELKELVNKEDTDNSDVLQYDRILTVNDVVQLLGLPRHIIYGKAMSGEMPSFRVGKRYKFSRKKVLEWFEEKFDKVEVDDLIDKYLQKNLLNG